MSNIDASNIDINLSTSNISSRISNLLSRPLVVIILITIIFLSALFEIGGIFTNFILFLLCIYFILFILQFVFKIDISAKIKGLFSVSPHLSLDVGSIDEIAHNDTDNSDNIIIDVKPTNIKEVFNIAGNNFTYETAQATCKAFGSELATYEQVEEAYNNGAEWCNYGWSDGQLALFPTQKKTFDKLQTIKGKENDCGRQGINGGFFEDPSIKFGANCYGKKPDINAPSEKLMNDMTYFPENKKDMEMQNKVDIIKANIDSIIINPFNSSQWKQY